MPVSTRFLVPLLCGAALAGLAREARADDPVKASCLAAFESGQRQRLAGELIESRASLQVCSRSECPEVVVRACARWLREVDDAIPTVILSASEPSGDDVRDARVLVDGELAQRELTGRPLEIDPGQHVFRFEAGARHAESRRVINAGEKNRLVRVTLPEADAVAGAPRPSRASRAAPWVLGGVGVALVTAGVVVDIAGSMQLDDLHERCHGMCSTSEVDATRTQLVVGDTLIVVGAVTVGAAALWLALRPATRPAAAAPASGSARRPAWWPAAHGAVIAF
jgi:hypothetical protein